MCGVAGVFLPHSAADLSDRIITSLRAMHHRGPDDVGYVIEGLEVGGIALGHARLSIIDLSVGGHQPMYSVCRRYAIVFNGEIYNFKELRAELVALGLRFSSDSDTEVLLAAWGVWGKECLPRLVGMFAFAVFDRDTATLTCVRDAFGIKPFFYLAEDGGFCFTSEIAALQCLCGGKARPNWQRAYDYLVHGNYDCGPETFFDGVMQLAPGHLLTVDLVDRTVTSSSIERWWNPKITERRVSFEEAVARVRESFLQSIRLHLRSDVPLGAALSGGVDSSAIVCAMRHVEPEMPISTFSFIAEGSRVNEEKWVDIVNKHVGAQAHKVAITPDELVRDIDDMIRVQGEPFGSMSIYAQYRVYQLAKQNGVTVTLDGQGADEILGGYVGFPGERVRSLLDLGEFREMLSFLNEWAKWPGRSLSSGLRAAVAECSEGVVHECLRQISGLNGSPDWIDQGIASDMGVAKRVPRYRSGREASGRRVVAQLLNMLTRHGLPALLRHGDRNSMRFSVESRVPFLSLEMVELMLSMPESYLVSEKGETKHVFRKAMQGIVPDEILFRRDKIGFEPPEKDWILAISDSARKWLSEDMEIPFIRRDLLLAHFDEVIAGRRAFSWQVWRWINFYRWRACIAG